MAFDPTTAQLALIKTPGSQFVEACPGAGKTQCIVQRFIERPGVKDRRGVALVSFTNAAIDEARSRCAGSPELLAVPNYVGTIDSFINRYIVRPMYASAYGRAPSFKDTWDAVPSSSFNVKGLNSAPFRLGWFSFAPDGAATLVPSQAPKELRRWLSGLEERDVARVATEAARLWNRFKGNGVIDCAASRHLMAEYLAHEKRRWHLKYLLASRFQEVIVDEVQDCCDTDVALIEFLIEAKLDVVLVGDLDQAIYDFRGASPKRVKQLVANVPSGDRINGNHRSSPTVCALVDSLRHGAAKDVALGKWSADALPVHVLKVSAWEQAHDRIIARLGEAGIAPSDAIVLAYRGEVARACANAAAEPSERSSNRLARLARAVTVFQDTTLPTRARVESVIAVETILRELADDDVQYHADERFYEATGLNHRTFRDGALRLASLPLSFASPPSVFQEQIKAGLTALGWTWASTARLRKPSKDKWPDKEPTPKSGVLRWSTVHGFKGLQALAAAVAIAPPPREVAQEDSDVALWDSDLPGEARRVLYVGASRAERLAILVVHESLYDAVVRCLDRDAVTYVTD